MSTKLITSVPVTRQNFQPSLLWGDDIQHGVYRNLQRLFVVVATQEDSDDVVIVYGVDPAHTDADRDDPIFIRFLQIANLATFLKILCEGEQPERPIPKSVDVPVTQPPTTGPKLRTVFAYAVTGLSADPTPSPPSP
jgi:hypothetical protein